jgi:hypothetical protein
MPDFRALSILQYVLKTVPVPVNAMMLLDDGAMKR